MCTFCPSIALWGEVGVARRSTFDRGSNASRALCFRHLRSHGVQKPWAAPLAPEKHSAASRHRSLRQYPNEPTSGQQTYRDGGAGAWILVLVVEDDDLPYCV